MATHVSKGSSSTLTKQKSWSSLAGYFYNSHLHVQWHIYGTCHPILILGTTLTCDGSMHTAPEKMANNLRSAIARVYRTGDSKISKVKTAVAFPGLCFDSWSVRLSEWATSSLTYDSSKITPTHILHLGFLERLLGVKKGTTHCVLRKTGQIPILFHCIGSDA